MSCGVSSRNPAYNDHMKRLWVIMLFLLLVFCTLWVASYWRIEWSNSENNLVLQLRDGSLMVAIYERGWTFYDDPTIAGYDDVAMLWWPVVWVYPELGGWVLRGLFWLPTLLLALLVAISASPWARRRSRAKQGLCIQCGYDLSGTDHDACPECGAEVVRA